jgi:putative flippase GtrA
VNSELPRYLISGGIAFAVDFLLLYLCTEKLGMHYLVSNVFGFSGGLLVTYVLNTRWVFRHRRFERRSGLEFTLFSGIVFAGLGLSEVLMAAMVGGLGIHYLAAKVFTAFFVMAFNFVAKKFLLFPVPAVPEQA